MKLNRYLLAALASVAFVLHPAPAQANIEGEVRAQPSVPSPSSTPSPPNTSSPPRTPSAPADDEVAETDDEVAKNTDKAAKTTDPAPCRPGTPDTAPATTEYFDDNPLLGPEALPEAPPVGPLVTGYQRFGALTEDEFLTQYGNEAKTAYVFPPALGFVIQYDGKPIKMAQTLPPGTRIDRFGFPGGAFLSPAGTPFAYRGLAPDHLNTPENAPLSNYHLYCVLKPFTVDAGPVAPWFAQSGLGTQYKLESKYLPDAGMDLSVTWLLKHKYLVEERPEPVCTTQPANSEATATEPDSSEATATKPESSTTTAGATC